MIAHQASTDTERARKIAAQHCFDVRRHIIKWTAPLQHLHERSPARWHRPVDRLNRHNAGLLPSKKQDVIPMRNVNGFRQRGDIPEMQKKDYQRCHCAETVEITLTTVSSARIRRYHAPDTGDRVFATKYWRHYTRAKLFPQHTLWSAAELATPRGINTKSRFVGQNNRKIGSNEHADR